MNTIPRNVRKIYLIAIAGTGMGSLAGLLKSQGYEIAGSDNAIYPPMSLELERQKIPVFTPYASANIESFAPDLVIVGNAVSRGNPEAEWLLKKEIPYVSMPQALNHFFLKEKEVIVISGTHGKTTTTALMAFLLQKLDQDPSYLIGGVSQDFASSFHVGSGKYFVIEGDEYDTAFFDKGPKFLHYNPRHVVMTSLEFDHADIYRDLDHLSESFEKLARIIPDQGSLHVCDAYPRLQNVSALTKAPVRRYGFVAGDWKITDYRPEGGGGSFDLRADDRLMVRVHSPMTGKHNALNVAACFSVLKTLGLDLHNAAEALRAFKGIKRRQEVRYADANLTVIDDFAHHPTAIRETIAAIRDRYSGNRLIAVFEPRSNTSMRDVFQKEFTESFAEADEVILAPVFNPQKIADGKILDVPRMITDINASGKPAYLISNTGDIITHIVNKTKKPATALIMSNGGFENIHARLIDAWKNR